MAINKDGTQHKSGWKFKQSDVAVEKIRQARKKQIHPGLLKYGITREQYDAEISSGKRWCSGYCKAFVPSSQFSQTQYRESRCNKCGAERAQRQRDKWTPEYREQRRIRSLEYKKEHEERARNVWIARYGVDQEWYRAQFSKQSGVCAICCTGGPSRGHKYLAIDHNHHSNKARGLLCNRCNSALERLDNVPDWMQKAAAYLAQYRE